MTLVEMTQAEYDLFLQRSLHAYTEELARCLGVPSKKLKSRTERQMKQMLARGRETEDHFFYHLKTETENLGWLWISIRESYGKRQLFICDIYVEEKVRGQGCGKFMMNWLETKAKELGLSEIGLHAFGHNSGARKLYESLGYHTSNVYMAKKL